MSITTGFASVANCYVFKSRLQEYAQKAGFLTPVYETVKEGPSHEPCFSSSVVVDNVKYNSLPGFYNRKAAEQSAAEVALLELAKSGKINESISCPVHETGLCKNLLQEYAQKMNYAMPSYVCRTHEAPGRKPFYSCTVDIGGIQYIGATATTKKEAELKAARTALLAIQSNTNGPESKPNGSHELTVLPCKRKGVEPDANKETPQPIKPKKAKFKKSQKKKSLQNRIDLATGNVENSLVPQGEDTGMLETIKDGHGGEHLRSQLNENEQVPITDPNNNFQHVQTIPLNSNLSDQGYSNMDVDSGVQVNDLVKLEKIVDEVGVEQMATFGAAEVPVVNGEKIDSDNSLVGLNHNENVVSEVKVEHEVEQVATFGAAEVPGFNVEKFDSNNSLVGLNQTEDDVRSEVKVEHGVEQVATVGAAEVPVVNGEKFDSKHNLVGLHQNEDVCREVNTEY
ncbi:Double-stranded rna-binding protein [Thalictrum thalictroides]|uniref:Double-stranded rna-binding protein n=1 Tax=Thalictrum thalictroides TaxID=46969 RepID=A0A7J6XEV6_THATH|nr:Double-stranded rna-binding protein [Thalictrum thalictroides]